MVVIVLLAHNLLMPSVPSDVYTHMIYTGQEWRRPGVCREQITPQTDPEVMSRTRSASPQPSAVELGLRILPPALPCLPKCPLTSAPLVRPPKVGVGGCRVPGSLGQ